MTHKITTIKAALASTLSGKTSVGTRVYVNRVRVLPENLLPAIVITFNRSSADRTIDQQLLRKGEFDIRILVKDQDAAAPDTQAEAILESVEAALQANLYLGGALHDEIEFGAVRLDSGDTLEVVTRELALTVSCPWIHDIYGLPTDDFEVAAVQIDMASPRNDPQNVLHPDGQIDAATTFDLPQ